MVPGPIRETYDPVDTVGSDNTHVRSARRTGAIQFYWIAPDGRVCCAHGCSLRDAQATQAALAEVAAASAEAE